MEYTDTKSRVERAKDTARLCEMMASAIRRDVYVMASCNKIGTAVGEGDKFVSPTGTNRKLLICVVSFCS